MYCGGQGIYAAYLAREWQRAGHDVHVIAGPPLPDLAPGIPLHAIPNANVFGLPLARLGEAARPARAAHAREPLGARRLAPRRLPRDAELRAAPVPALARAPGAATASTSCSTTRASRWGLLGLRATGVPVVSVIHHPLHLDREADFAVDPRLAQEGAPHALLPALHAAGGGEAARPHRDRERGLARARSSAASASPRRRSRSSTTAPTPSASARTPRSRSRRT